MTHSRSPSCVGRYSRAITAIEDLLTTWDSMSYVQKASPTEIARLVFGGEAIINDERLAWQRTGIRKDSGVEVEGQVQKVEEKIEAQIHEVHRKVEGQINEVHRKLDQVLKHLVKAEARGSDP